MFRNQYDTDVTVWSPEGRLLQVSCVQIQDTAGLAGAVSACVYNAAYRITFKMHT